MSSIRVEDETFIQAEDIIQGKPLAITIADIDYVEAFLILCFFVSLYRFLSSFCINDNRLKSKDE